MTDDEPDYGDIPRDGAGERWLTLEAAIKQIIEPPRLKALFDRARQPAPPAQRAYNFQREQKATLAPLFQLLDEGKIAIKVRSWSQVGGPMRRLRPDETSQLTIDLYADSPLLYGPGGERHGERLYALFSPADKSKIEETVKPANVRHDVTERWRDKPSQANVSAFVRGLETEYSSGAIPAESEVLKKTKVRFPKATRRQVRVALKDSPLKGEPGYKSRKA